MGTRANSSGKTVEALRHHYDKRRNTPTLEYQAVLQEETKVEEASMR
jgi:hypothetical protein